MSPGSLGLGSAPLPINCVAPTHPGSVARINQVIRAGRAMVSTSAAHGGSPWGLWKSWGAAPRPLHQNLRGWGPSEHRYFLEPPVVLVGSPCGRWGCPALAQRLAHGGTLPAPPARGDGGPRHSPAPSSSSFFEGVQQRALRHSLRGWCLRARDPGSARTTLAPAVLGGVLGGKALPGHRTPCSSLEQVKGRGWGGLGRGGEGGEGWQHPGHPGLHSSFPRLPGPPPSWRCSG